MILSAHATSSAAARRTWVPSNEADCLKIRDELERILASPHFRNSRRYPALLRYVVEKALSGDVEDVKERTLGVEVFHRPADYDTNADPVVRFSAGEIRRRIAQYYQENGNCGLIEISLPVGSYVPQFFHSGLEPKAHSVPQDKETSSSVESGTAVVEPSPVSASETTPDKEQLKAPYPRRSFVFGTLCGLAAAAAGISISSIVRSSFSPRVSKTAIMELWGPLLTHSDEVLITVGRTHVEEKEPPEPPNATIEQHILRPDARISFAAVQAVSQVAGFLQAQHKPFSLHEAYSNSLQDLHRRPVVLVSGYNNLWTMRLLKPLRFHLDQAGSLHSIVDEQHPEQRGWSVDFDKPYLQQTFDYAIVGRFYDATTDGPVVVVAGIGSNGSQAAGEFMVSSDALEMLARSAPHGSLNQNFEAVLKVEVIAGNTGAATVIATQFW